MIAGLARPQAGKAESRITGQGIAIEMVLDVSGSMEAIDFQLDGQGRQPAGRGQARDPGIRARLAAPADCRAAPTISSGSSPSAGSPTASVR